MLDGCVADGWAAWFACPTVGLWLETVVRAREQLARWRARGRVPLPLELGSLCRPRALLEALRHEAARAARASVADVTLAFEVTAARRAAHAAHQRRPGDPLVLSGLYATGCQWDAAERCVSDVSSKNWWTDPVTRFPLLRVQAVVAAGAGVAAAAAATAAAATREHPPRPRSGLMLAHKPPPPVPPPAAAEGAKTPYPPGRGGGGDDEAEAGGGSSPRAVPQQRAAIPLYTSPVEPPLFSVLLPTRMESNHWVLRNASLVCRYQSWLLVSPPLPPCSTSGCHNTQKQQADGRVLKVVIRLGFSPLFVLLSFFLSCLKSTRPKRHPFGWCAFHFLVACSECVFPVFRPPFFGLSSRSFFVLLHHYGKVCLAESTLLHSHLMSHAPPPLPHRAHMRTRHARNKKKVSSSF